MFHVEQSQKWIDVLKEGAASFGLSLHDYTVTQFAVYLKELRTWNEKTNLTGSQSDKEVVIKHFVDSMVACQVILPLRDSQLIDIGSGAGFPGLVLKLVIPEINVTLLDPSQKRVAFLRHLIGKLHLKNIEVVAQGISEFAMNRANLSRYTFATVRALSAGPFLSPIWSVLCQKGKLLLYRTRVLDKKLLFEINSNKFEIFQQLPYSLIHDFGNRMLAIVQKSDQDHIKCT